MTQDNSTNTIAILQYNLRKNSSRTHSILSDPSSKKFTILMIQEQYWSDITESTPVHGSWTPVLANERTQIRSDPVPGLSVDTLGGYRVGNAVTRSESDAARAG